MRREDKFMPISTLEDLLFLVNHNTEIVNKRIFRLARRNRGVVVVAAAAIGIAAWSELERRKQEEQLYQLSVRLKKLEYDKEE